MCPTCRRRRRRTSRFDVWKATACHVDYWMQWGDELTPTTPWRNSDFKRRHSLSISRPIKCGASFMTPWRNPVIWGNCLPSRESIGSIFMLGFLSFSSIRLYRTRRVTPGAVLGVLCQTPRQIGRQQRSAPKTSMAVPPQSYHNWILIGWHYCNWSSRKITMHYRLCTIEKWSIPQKANTWRMHGCWGSLHRDFAHQSLDLCATQTTNLPPCHLARCSF